MEENLRKFILILDVNFRNFSAIQTMKFRDRYWLSVRKDPRLLIMNTLILLLPSIETGAGFQRKPLH